MLDQPSTQEPRQLATTPDQRFKSRRLESHHLATNRLLLLRWDRTTRPPPKLDLASTGQKMYDQASSLEIPGFDAFAMTAIDPGMLALIWFLCLGNG